MDGKVKTLFDMGFNQIESEMALKDTAYNIDKAVERLVAGEYKPPPYDMKNSATPIPYNQTLQYAAPQSKSRSSHSPFTKKTKLPLQQDISSAPDLFDLKSSTKLTQLPPPYEKLEKADAMCLIETSEDFSCIDRQKLENSSVLSKLVEERCSSCFNELVTTTSYESRKLTYTPIGETIMKQRGKYYHEHCFRKKFGAKCSYCCFLLSEPDKDNDLSGQYLVYKNKKYHVECYEKYAGPRCSYCFNVIIEKPSGEYSGNWIVDQSKEYHVECYEKRMNSIWKAQNS